MTVATEDSLFDAPGPFGVLLQELEIVVGFKHQDVGVFDPFDNKLGGVTEIRQEANITGGGSQKESDRVISVVGHRKRVNGDIPDLKTGARAEQTAVEAGLQLVLDGFLGQTIAVDWNLHFGGKPDQPLDMIRVLMSDENSLQAFGRPSDAGQALANLASAEAGVDEQPCLAGLEIGAISAGTAAKNGELNGHDG